MAERKNARFSVIPARTGSVVLLCHFFDGPDDSPEFQVIMEMDGGVDDGVATLLPDGDDRTATLSWNLFINILTSLRVFCNSQSLLRLQLQEVPSHALRSLQRLEQLDLSHLARLSQVQVGLILMIMMTMVII